VARTVTTPHTLVIAEAGVNHNGSLRMALALVDAAADAGADYVKFQTFKASSIASDKAVKADYQKRTTKAEENQLAMLRRLELSAAHHRKLIARCRQRGVKFLSTPFDSDSIDFLAKGLTLKLLKVPSGEITNALLLLQIARTGKDLILSTGMATLAEIKQALGVLAFGYVSPRAAPSRAAFTRAYSSAAGRAALKKRLALLHCTTEYPAPFDDVNLRAMETLSRAFGLRVGYSDHTPGIAISIAAVARGATIIEKHITLDRNLPGPDHRASIEPDEFAAMVKAIREVEQSIGDGRKICRPSEAKNRVVARKSLVAARPIAKGEAFSAANLTAKRPGGGRSTFDYWSLTGKRARRAYKEDDPI
jgi:N-acetylneuraminate synthase